MKTLLTRGFAVSIATFLMAGSAIAAGAAPAEPGPDRSQLSLEENVAINAACFPVRKQGDSAYEKCVNTQLAALKQHPSPDRSALTPQRNQQIEYACAAYRTRGIAAYNDCLTQQISGAAPAATTTTTEEEDKDTDLTAAVKQIADEKPSATPVAMTTIGSPAAALPNWSEHMEGQALSAKDFFKKASASVYTIIAAPTLADLRGHHYALGSGVAVTEHLLLTNCHVVNDRPLIRIFYDRTPSEATLVGADRSADRCVLKTETTLVPVAGVRAFDDLAQGEHVFAIGTPIGLQHTLSEGLISGLHPGKRAHIVQTSAPISPGSSGGGLFDERGNLIGITEMELVGGGVQNLNFAIAASDFWH